MRRANTFLAICAAWIITGTVRAGDGTPAVNPLQVSVQREPVDYADPYYRAYINAGSAKLSFLLPHGFRLKGDPATGLLTIGNLDGTCTISFRILGPTPEGGTLATETYREYLLKQHTTARITREFSAHVGGVNGPAFDLQWKVTPELTQRKRAVFVPSPLGVIEFTIVAGSAEFPAMQANLSTVMNTFCYSVNGKLQVVHLANDS